VVKRKNESSKADRMMLVLLLANALYFLIVGCQSLSIPELRIDRNLGKAISGAEIEYAGTVVKNLDKDYLPVNDPFSQAFLLVSEDRNQTLVLCIGEMDARGKPVQAAYIANQVIITAEDGSPYFIPGKSLKAGRGLEIQILDANVKKDKFLAQVMSQEPYPFNQAAAILSDIPGVTAVEPNYLVRFAGNQYATPYNRDQWQYLNWGQGQYGFDAVYDADVDGLEAIATLAGWRYPKQVTAVAVIDSGIDKTHAAFKDAIWTNPGEIPANGIDDDSNGYIDDINGWDFVNNRPDVVDYDGHGTHVAGIIAARKTAADRMQGLSPEALIVPLKVIRGQGQLGQTWWMVKAIEYAYLNKIPVTNISMGSPVYSSAMNREINIAVFGNDMVISAAAGNDGRDIYRYPVYPASYPAVHAVAATTPQDRLWPDSNFQGTNNIPGLATIYISAPGVRIYSTLPGQKYGLKSGTSMASPHVAACAAMLRSIYPDEDRVRIWGRIMRSADQKEALQDQLVKGRRLNAYRAIYYKAPEPGKDGVTEYRNVRVNGYMRSLNYPYANSGEPGIDGSSRKKAFAVCTMKQLLNIRRQDMDKHFILMNDLDWKSLGPNEEKMIVYPGVPFNGTIWGNGYTIHNLTFATQRNRALFAEIGPTGRIVSLSFAGVNLDLIGSGATVALKSRGGLNFVQAEGAIKVTDTAAGLVARQEGGWINNSFFEGRIESDNAGGGIAADISRQANLRNCSFQGRIESRTGGGIANRLSFSSTVSRSHALLRANAANGFGGIAASVSCQSLIKHSYTEGTIVSTRQAGGLVGWLENSRIEESYSLSYLFGSGSDSGGAVGLCRDNVQRCIFNGDMVCVYVCTDSPTQTAPPSAIVSTYFDEQLNPVGCGGEPRTRGMLKIASTFPGWQFGSVWSLPRDFTPVLINIPRAKGTFRPVPQAEF